MLMKFPRFSISDRISALALSLKLWLVLLILIQPSAAQNGLNVWKSNGPFADVRSVVVDPTDPNVIYTWGFTGIFKSVNNGASWISSNNGLNPFSVRGLAIDPRNPKILYAGLNTGAGGVFKTTDGGENWISTNSLSDVYQVAVAPSNSSITYAASSSGSTGNILVTTNGGETWDTRPVPDHNPPWAGLEYQALEVDPQDPLIIYISILDLADFSGLYRSTDGGANWLQMSLPVTYMLRVDPVKPNIIYAATGAGIYKSMNRGADWTLLGVPGHAGAVTIDPLNRKILYAGVTSSGVYKSTDAGATWSPFNNGLTNLMVWDLEFDCSGKFLHAATRSGVFSVKVRMRGSTQTTTSTDELDMKTDAIPTTDDL